MVERIPCCAWTSNGLVLTMLMSPHYWLIENQSIFTNKSRHAIVLAYNFFIYSELFRSNSRNYAPFVSSYKEKRGTAG